MGSRLHCVIRLNLKRELRRSSEFTSGLTLAGRSMPPPHCSPLPPPQSCPRQGARERHRPATGTGVGATPFTAARPISQSRGAPAEGGRPDRERLWALREAGAPGAPSPLVFIELLLRKASDIIPNPHNNPGRWLLLFLFLDKEIEAQGA